MTKIMTFKCDRLACGKHYGMDSVQNSLSYTFTGPKVSQTAGDLCPACAKEFLAFFSKVA